MNVVTVKLAQMGLNSVHAGIKLVKGNKQTVPNIDLQLVLFHTDTILKIIFIF